tara:strand:+ start:5857 stop:6516 length:660 start_codon:yes stop_codon:yes gene_type:complete
MNELIFKQEFVENWVKILLIISTLLIVTGRKINGEKFEFLIKFWNIHRYFIYKYGSTIPFFTTLNALMFFLRVIIFSLFFSLFIFPNKFDEFQFKNFIIISLLMVCYIILKYLIEKTLSVLLNYNNILIEINRYRIGLKNLIAIHFYFYFIILIFNPISYNSTIALSFILFSIYLFFTSSYVLKKYSNKTFKGLVCFILYLCTVEIAPASIVMWQTFKF